jgi:hypothetical protein
MFEINDPRTASALAHYARSDRINEVAAHQRYRSAIRSQSPDPVTTRTAARPITWFRRRIAPVL